MTTTTWLLARRGPRVTTPLISVRLVPDYLRSAVAARGSLARKLAAMNATELTLLYADTLSPNMTPVSVHEVRFDRPVVLLSLIHI